MILAEDYKTTHRLKAGDVISADVLNEMFDEVENAKKSIEAADLEGTWICTSIAPSDFRLQNSETDPDSLALPSLPFILAKRFFTIIPA